MISGKRNIKDGSEFNSLFPAPDKNDPFIYRNGSIDDTMTAMNNIVSKYNWQTAEIAKILKGDNVQETCYNIWKFIQDYIQFEKDKDGVEQIRTPARTFADRKTGVDCDCMCVFAGSVLTQLGIPYSFRITKYSSRPNWEHVYIIVPTRKGVSGPSGNIVIDGVITSDFNYEKEYTNKKDYMAALNGIPVQILDGIVDDNGIHINCCDKILMLLKNTRNIIANTGAANSLIHPDDALQMLDYAIKNWADEHNRITVVEYLANIEKEKFPQLSLFQTILNYYYGDATHENIENANYLNLPNTNLERRKTSITERNEQIEGLGKIPEGFHPIYKYYKDEWNENQTILEFLNPIKIERTFSNVGDEIEIIGSENGEYDGKFKVGKDNNWTKGDMVKHWVLLRKPRADSSEVYTYGVMEPYYMSNKQLTSYPTGHAVDYRTGGTFVTEASKNTTLKGVLYAIPRNSFLFLIREINWAKLGTRFALAFMDYEIAKLGVPNLKKAEWDKYRAALTEFLPIWCTKWGGHFWSFKEAVFALPDVALIENKKKIIDLMKPHKNYNYYRYYDNWGGVPSRAYTTLKGLHGGGLGYDAGTLEIIGAALTAAAALLAIVIPLFSDKEITISPACQALIDKVNEGTLKAGDAEWTAYLACAADIAENLGNKDPLPSVGEAAGPPISLPKPKPPVTAVTGDSFFKRNAIWIGLGVAIATLTVIFIIMGIKSRKQNQIANK